MSDKIDRWSLRLEFKIEDLWVGLFWKNRVDRFDLWICLIPCVPVHVWFRKTECESHR